MAGDPPYFAQDRSPEPRLGHFVIGGRIGPSDAPALCQRAIALLNAPGTTLVCELGGLVRVDVGTVDALARVALSARGLGCGVRLQEAPVELRALLEFVGLAQVMPCVAGSGGQSRG